MSLRDCRESFSLASLLQFPSETLETSLRVCNSTQGSDSFLRRLGPGSRTHAFCLSLPKLAPGLRLLCKIIWPWPCCVSAQNATSSDGNATCELTCLFLWSRMREIWIFFLPILLAILSDGSVREGRGREWMEQGQQYQPLSCLLLVPDRRGTKGFTWGLGKLSASMVETLGLPGGASRSSRLVWAMVRT